LIDTIEQIRDLTKVGPNPKHIRAAIVERDSQSIITQGLAGRLQSSYYRGEHLESRTPVEEWVVQAPELIFASQSLMRCFPDLVLIEATYKTNRYNMPLLHFNGVTPIPTSFLRPFASCLEKVKKSVRGL
jgi:hypothetical protein